MTGYWNRPDETAKVLSPDGFLATGDMAMLTPDGFVKLVDRKKDMILVSGFNVYPNEIEDVVASHPACWKWLASACRTTSPAKWSRCSWCARPRAERKDIVQHCRDNLTGYKVPKLVEFRDELPKTNVGKILRRALRDERRRQAGLTMPRR